MVMMNTGAWPRVAERRGRGWATEAKWAPLSPAYFYILLALNS